MMANTSLRFSVESNPGKILLTGKSTVFQTTYLEQFVEDQFFTDSLESVPSSRGYTHLQLFGGCQQYILKAEFNCSKGWREMGSGLCLFLSLGP